MRQKDKGAQGAGKVACNRQPDVDGALQSVVYLLLDCLHYLILSYNLYNIAEEWNNLVQFEIVQESFFKNMKTSHTLFLKTLL